MKKEVVQARLELLNQQKANQQQLYTNIHNTIMAYDGAIQECTHWLNSCEEEKVVKKKKVKILDPVIDSDNIESNP